MYIYILHYIVTFTYIFYIWCNMIYVFDCFPWILRFNIGPARENRDRVYVTDAKCPHQGGFRNRRNNHFDHLQKMDFLIKGEENIGKFIWYIYIYTGKWWETMGKWWAPMFVRYYIGSPILTWCHGYIGLLFWDDENSPQWQRSWQFGLRLMAGYRSISMARHRLVTWRPPMLGLQGLQWIELSSGNQHIQQLCSARS